MADLEQANMAPLTMVDRSAAEEYIRALFRYVLERTSMADEEVESWTQEVLNGRSVTEVLELFAISEENQKRLRSTRRHATHYPNGHFYSPVVNVEEVKAQSARIFKGRVPLSLDLNADRQFARFREISSDFADMPWSEESDGRHRYFYNNSSYSFGDACVYWGMIANLKPKRIIEIGSGFTSALALDAIEHLGLPTRCTFIDPYPELLHRVAGPIPPLHDVIEDFVQNVDPDIVGELAADDLLFIDSSHVVKTGSDVHFEITELLPRLRPGVIVHFHDVFHPFEYPFGWVIDDNYSWNELYFLQAFLMYNSAFEIVYFNHFLAREHGDFVRASLPQAVASRILRNPGGGLWLRRRATRATNAANRK